MIPTAYESGPEDGPLVVLVHGTPDRRNAFRRVAAHLPDYRLLTYDRRGYGESASLPPATTLVQHAHDLLAIIGDRRVVAVGHSFGGNAVIQAAMIDPARFHAVGLWESSMCWLPGWPQDHIDGVRAMAETPDPRELGERINRGMLGDAWDRLDDAGRELRRVEGIAFALDMSFLLSRPFDLGELEVPFVHGVGTDTIVPHAVGAPLIAKESGVEPLVYEGLAHLAHTQAPETWASFVRAVVAAVRRA